MKVGTRITAAASAFVAAALGLYAVIELRSAAERRRESLEREVRNLAYSLRASLESRGAGAVLSGGDELSEELSRVGRWRVTLLSREEPAGPGGPSPQLERLRTLVNARPPHLSGEDHGRFFFTVPIRRLAPSSPEGYEILGALEISGSTDRLAEASHDELARTLSLMAAIVLVLGAAIMGFTRIFVSRPIDKLIAGIDDVAKGDLSRVLLSEREDEVGALASRFNEMTFSLRESRAETKRQNDTKMQLEERLSHTEKLATIGQLAAEIAHEVGTPLSVIAGRARSIARRPDDREVVSKKAHIIAEQTSRITRIIQRLLDVTRRSVGAAEQGDVNLNEVTLTTMDFLEGRMAAAGVHSSLYRAEGLPTVRGHQDQLQQVLLNLLINAIEAMPGGGHLSVDTSLRSRRRPGLELAPEQPTVMVAVADSGAGIPEELRDAIFEPFYTSKQGQGGSGLGLAVSHGIIKQHDGWIEIDDNPGGGTVFRICLPVAEAP